MFVFVSVCSEDGRTDIVARTSRHKSRGYAEQQPGRKAHCERCCVVSGNGKQGSDYRGGNGRGERMVVLGEEASQFVVCV